MSVARHQVALGPRARPEPHAAILMGLCDGGPWIGAQLDSIREQNHTNWSLMVSDDGSIDNGAAVVDRFADGFAPGTVKTRDGPGRGFVRNYLSMLSSVPPSAECVVFCDQDDVWLPDRLARASAVLAQIPVEVPALYLSTTWITSQDLTRQGRSRPVRRDPCFANALVQCIGGGNTMAVNRAGQRLLRAAVPEGLLATGGIGPASHDWWMYQMISGAGGRIVADPRPSVLYRQHGWNQSGSNRGARALARRAWQVLRGDARRMVDRNLAALNASAERLTPSNRRLLRQFETARNLHIVARLFAFRRLGLHRQTRAGTLVLWLAGLLRLI